MRVRRLLFTRESACLQPLLSLIALQTHRTLVLWALEYAERLADKFELNYPDESRPRTAVDTCRAWARGEVKMPAAKRAIHAAHNAAAELSDDIVCCAIVRAIGQAVSTVHVETHAIGGPMYALTAIVHEHSKGNAQEAVAAECDRLYKRLLFWAGNADAVQTPWADFLRREHAPNKEKLRREKRARTAHTG